MRKPIHKWEIEEAARWKRQMETETHTGDKGELRWNSNGHCVPIDCMEYAGYPVPAAQKECIRTENEKAVAEYVAYREKNGYTEEEKFEMRAAFGDETVVDVFTGKKIKL
jgi:hypothetical protein